MLPSTLFNIVFIYLYVICLFIYVFHLFLTYVIKYWKATDFCLFSFASFAIYPRSHLKVKGCVINNYARIMGINQGNPAPLYLDIP